MPQQQGQVNELIERLNKFTMDQLLFDSAPKSLRQYIGLVSQCDAVLGNEGGAINMGKAAGIPSLLYFHHRSKNKDGIMTIPAITQFT